MTREQIPDSELVAKYRLKTYGARDFDRIEMSADEIWRLLDLADEALGLRAGSVEGGGA